MKKILITGGAGFIGSNFVHYIANQNPDIELYIVDKLTYAGNIDNLAKLISSKKIEFFKEDIKNTEFVKNLISSKKIDTIVNFAAESHVDRSIVNPDEFIETNIKGTFSLLQACMSSWKNDFTNKMFYHISTDEVYGELDFEDDPFDENSPYLPRSPYSASKAASDHLVRSYFHTYGLPVLISNCSNNFGPFQFPEKLIPLTIKNILLGLNIPIYGKGNNIRDWLFVNDHCSAIFKILLKGKKGETYNIGAKNEIKNIDLVILICDMLDKKILKDKKLQLKYKNSPASKGQKSVDLISYVKDRAGHDKRYAINTKKIELELGFKNENDFKSDLDLTIQWYINNNNWWQELDSKFKKYE